MTEAATPLKCRANRKARCIPSAPVFSVGLFWFFLATLTGLLPISSYAADHAVTNLNDSGAGSLRAALDIVAAGDTITFTPALAGTIDLASALPNLPSLTFVNAGDITLSRVTGDAIDTVLIANDGATLSGSLPSTSQTTDTDANGIIVIGSLTLADTFSGAITSRGKSGADGIFASDQLTMGDFSGTISSTTTHSGTARGLFAQNTGISLNDFIGNITIDSARAGFGINTNGTLFMQNLAGIIDVTAGENGRGLSSDAAMSINNITGTVNVKTTSQRAYGLWSGDNLAINSISGAIDAESTGDSAYGLYSSGVIDNGGGALPISGSVTAKAKDTAWAIYALNSVNLNISGTVCATSSSSTAYAIYSGNNNDTVSLANGANVRGDIEMGGGTNTLTMDGAGTLDGSANNITAMTKSGAGTWDISGKINTGTLEVQAGKLNVSITQTSSPTIDASGTITNNGEIALSISGATIPAATNYIAISSPNALAGTYSFVSNMFYSMTQRANDVIISKDSYAGIISENKETEAVAAAFDSNPAAAGSDLEAVTIELEKSSNANELGECLSQLNMVNPGSVSGISTNTAHLFSTAAQTRMAEVRTFQIMMADKDEPDPDAPESWPMVAANGDLAGIMYRQPDHKPNGLHMRVLGKTGDMQSHDGYDGYDYDTFALFGGYDRVVREGFLMGVSGGYALTQADYKDIGGSDSQLDSYTLGLYGTWFKDDWYVDTAFAGAYNQYDISRKIPFLSRTATSNSNGYALSAKTSGGHRFEAGKYGLTPMASLEYTRFHQNGYTESGAGAVNLSVEAIKSNFLESGLGGKIDRSWDTDFGRIIPEVTAMWMHEWLTQDRNLTYNMTGMPGTSLSQTTAEAANDALRFSAGLRAIHNDGLVLSLRYQGEVESYATSHSLMVEAQVVF